MGTIAARDAIRVLELSEQVAAANLIATVQALRLRLREGRLSHASIGPRIEDFLAEIAAAIPFMEEDMALDMSLRRLTASIEARGFSLPESVSP